MKKNFVIQREGLDQVILVQGEILYTESDFYIEVTEENKEALRLAQKTAAKGDKKIAPKN